MIKEKTGVSDEPMNRKTARAADGKLPRPDFTPWLGCGTSAMRGWIEAHSALLQSTAGMVEQMASFSQTRLRTDLDLWRTLSGCGSMDEIVGCQMQYVQRTTADYLDGLKNLAARMRGAVEATALPSQE